jgi:hypothetical protein
MVGPATLKPPGRSPTAPFSEDPLWPGEQSQMYTATKQRDSDRPLAGGTGAVSPTFHSGLPGDSARLPIGSLR